MLGYSMLEPTTGDRPETKRNPTSMRGDDNMAAVTRVSRCGGAGDKRAGLGIRMASISRLEGRLRSRTYVHRKNTFSRRTEHLRGCWSSLASGSHSEGKVQELANIVDWWKGKRLGLGV